jgi:hypothetical protein
MRTLHLWLALAVTGAAATTGCVESAGQTAPYVAEQPGRLYRYDSFTNTVTRAEGWDTYFVDNLGRPGLRRGVFITDDPNNPADIGASELEALWPLEVGKATIVNVERGEERWRWEFRVTGKETINVPAGTYDTFIVQGVLTPELVHDPAGAVSLMNTWWYSPETAAVVRFRTTYLSGPGAGRAVEGSLQGIEDSPASQAREPVQQ